MLVTSRVRTRAKNEPRPLQKDVVPRLCGCFTDMPEHHMLNKIVFPPKARRLSPKGASPLPPKKPCDKPVQSYAGFWVPIHKEISCVVICIDLYSSLGIRIYIYIACLSVLKQGTQNRTVSTYAVPYVCTTKQLGHECSSHICSPHIYSAFLFSTYAYVCSRYIYIYILHVYICIYIYIYICVYMYIDLKSVV